MQLNYIFRIVLLVMVFSFVACDESVSKIDDGEVVHVETASSPIILGCFGQPWCVCLEEERRAIFRKSTGELTVFCLDCSGVTYLSSDYYDYIYAESDDCDQFEEDVDSVPGLRAQVVDYCLANPEACAEGFPEECDEP